MNMIEFATQKRKTKRSIKPNVNTNIGIIIMLVMNKKEILEEIKAILKDYHYDSDTENMSKDVVIALENLVKN